MHLKFLTYPNNPNSGGVRENPKLGQKVLYITPATCTNVRLIRKSRLKVKVGEVSFGKPCAVLQ